MAAPCTLKIGGATIGGPLGSTSGLVVGSIFYDKHSLVFDAFAGTFDEARAARSIARVNALATRYGVQMAFDLIASSPEAMTRYVAFVAPRTRLPLMINATDIETRVAGLAAVARHGVLDRCIYSSLTLDSEAFELEALRRTRPAAVVVLANDARDPTPENACALVAQHYQPMLRAIGVDVPIVDLGTMDPPSIGICMRGIQAIRARFGYPAGCAFANAFSRWTGLRAQGPAWVNLSLASALVACRGAGADFLHYGLIERAAVAAHAAATAEVFHGFAAQFLDGHHLPADHALYRMFKLAEPSP